MNYLVIPFIYRSIDMYGGNGRSFKADKACVRDLEGDAKRIRKAMENFKAFASAIKAFSESNEFRYIDSLEDRKTLYTIYGDLSLKVPSMEKEYQMILDEMEKAK